MNIKSHFSFNEEFYQRSEIKIANQFFIQNDISICSSFTKCKTIWPSVVYLAGPMEYAESLGISWRKYSSSILADANIIALSPQNFEHELIEEFGGLHNIKKLKASQDLTKFNNLMIRIAELDLYLIGHSDIVLVYYEGEKFSGTVDEVCNAKRWGKEVILASPLNQVEIPGWFMAHCTKVFTGKYALDMSINYILSIREIL